MKKKIVKRSLALGALMAFVITGSAFAADYTGDYSCDKSKGGVTLGGGDYALQVNSSDTYNFDSVKVINYWKDTDGKQHGSNGIGGLGTLNAGSLLNISAITNGIVGYYSGELEIKATDIIINDIRQSAAINANAANNIIKINSFDNLTITATTVRDAYVDSGNNIPARGEGVGVQATSENSKVIIEGNAGSSLEITSSQNGLYARNEGASIEITGVSNVKVETKGVDEGDAFRGNAVVSRSGGSVSINGADKIELIAAKNVAGIDKIDSVKSYAIYTTNDSGNTVDINNDGKATLVVDGDILNNSGTVTTNFSTSDSKLTGSVTGEGTTNLTFSNGATWTMTGASEVSTLDGDGGKIVFDDELLDNEANAENLLNITNNTSENLYVTSNTDLEKEENPTETATKQLRMMRAAFGNADNGATFAFEETDVLGAFVLGEDGKTVTELVNTQNQAIGEAAVGAKIHNRAHMNDMNKRMGELRNANGEHGVWVRMVRGEQEYSGVKAQYNQYQLGYDEKLSVDKRWTVGAAVTFAEGDSNFKNGSTEDDSTAFAIYGSKLNNDGTFVDLIARYARLESDVTVNAVQGDYSTNGYSVSAEFGKRFTKENGTWIEPQFELTYGTVDSAEYVLGGKTVQVGEMDSLIARAGFAIGKNIKQGNVYARASYLYDFDGETDTAFTSAAGTTRVIPEDLGGGWWEVGVGANINLSKCTYIYADVEKTFGGEVDTNWQWNLGVRYSF